MSLIRPATLTVAIVAVLVSLGAAFAVRKYLEEPPAAPVADEPKAQPRVRYVPLAAIDLEAGRVLRKGDIAIAARTSLRDISPKSLLNVNDLMGRILREPVKAGETFLVDQLYPEGTGPSLSEKLKPGFRAVTIPVRGTNAIEGFAGPGDLVDVLFRSNPRSARGDVKIPEATVTLLENVEVLALGTRATATRDSDRDSRSVTLAVSPEQAKVLKVVEGRGELSLALRSPAEFASATGAPTKRTLEDVLGIEPEEPPAMFEAEIYRGTSRHSISFKREHVVDESFGGLTQTPAKSSDAVTTAVKSAAKQDSKKPEG